MITEVYINNLLIDIDEEEAVTASYGNVSFGELSKRKGVRSNTWVGPFTQRNKTVFESCEVQGSYSVVPYRRSTIRVEVYGVNVFEGFCIIREAQYNYEIQSFSGGSDFYSTINKRKLTDLNLTEYDHAWNEINIRNSWSNTKGYIYAAVNYGKIFDLTNLPPDYLLPQIYFHTVVKQIASDAGYEIFGDVLTNPKFLKRVIICNKFPLPIIYGGDFKLSYGLHDIAQSKIWLDFANIYGLQFEIDEDLKQIFCTYIDDVLFNDPEEWTDKVDSSEKPRTQYSLGYGQRSYLQYKTDEVCVDSLGKEILIDDTTLDEEATIYESQFFGMQPFDFFGFAGTGNTYTYTIKEDKSPAGIWDSASSYIPENKSYVWWNGSYYLNILASTNHQPPNPTYWKPVKESDIWDIKGRPMYGMLITNVGSVFQVKFPDGNAHVTKMIVPAGLSWEEIYTERYKLFNRIIQRTKKVENLIKLNYADINQLDFTKAKRINNELYIVEEVKQFKLNKKDSTLVDMIRI